ncbi:MAG: poly-beta-1,6 N-acetyl-D-glucosamine export porin PgaA [Nitrospirota bacterium]|nr:poly-beta-1,6 N-acetyl-D-glucosamine export porin PgaA [Nitrospirota bacterium]
MGPSASALLALVWAICIPVAPSLAADSALEGEHAQAVELARAGAHGQAVAILIRLADNPDAPPVVRYDLVTVLAWARRDAEAVAAADSLNLTEAPAYMLEELGRAARVQGRLELAQTAWRLALLKEPERLSPRVGLALAAADRGQTDDARGMLLGLQKIHPDDAEVARALAYVEELRGDPAAALGAAQRALRADSGSMEARRRQILLAARLGAPQRALQLAQAYPGVLTEAETARIRADVAAITLRWGTGIDPADPSDPSARFDAVDRALELLAENRAAARRAGDGEAETVARHDTVVALVARERYRDAVEAYRALLADGDTPPPYVLVAAADALRARSQPEEAIPLYREAAALEGDPFDTRLRLIHTLGEAGRDAQAVTEAEQLAAEQPPTLHDRVNPRYLDAQLTLALAHRFAGNPERARRIVESLYAMSPGNQDLLSELAALQLADGQAQRALQAYRTGLAADPDHPGLREGEVYALLDLLAYREAALKVAELGQRFPGTPMAARLARITATEHRPLWTVSVQRRTSNGVALGSSGTALESFLYGGRRGKLWRPFVHGRWEQGRFSGGTERVRHAGIGAEWSLPRLSTRLELHADRNGGSRSGVLAEAEYRLADPLTVGVMHDTATLDLPLEALQNDVDAWQTRGSAAWRPVARRTLSASVTRTGFSDGNRRTGYYGAWDEQWFAGRMWRLSTRADMYRSVNSLTGASYYNPGWDRARSLTVEPRQRIYRAPVAHGERFFDHGIAATVGRYAQENFDVRPTWKLRYDQWWQRHDRLTMSWGAAIGRAAYDGAGETEREVFASLERRF